MFYKSQIRANKIQTQTVLDRQTSSDEEILFTSVKSPSVFAVLVDRYQGSFLRTAMKIVRSKEDAEDVVQETFVKIYRNAGGFRKMEGASFKSWAYKILSNTAFNHYKKIKKNFERSEQFNPVFHDVPVGGAEGSGFRWALESGLDYKHIVIKVLLKLPEHLSGVLKKYYLEDKSHRNIAGEEGVSVATVKMRLFRARKEFRKAAGSEKNFSWPALGQI